MCAIFEFSETTSLLVFTRVNNFEHLPGFPGNSRNHGNLRGARCPRGATCPRGTTSLAALATREDTRLPLFIVESEGENFFVTDFAENWLSGSRREINVRNFRVLLKQLPYGCLRG